MLKSFVFIINFKSENIRAKRVLRSSAFIINFNIKLFVIFFNKNVVTIINYKNYDPKFYMLS